MTSNILKTKKGRGNTHDRKRQKETSGVESMDHLL